MKDFNNYLLLVSYIKEHYDKGISELLEDENREKAEEIFLSAIKEFSGFDYNAKNKFFTKDLEDKTFFASEAVELENIDSLADLYLAIDHLNKAYHIRNQQINKQNNISLPKHLYAPVKEVQDISRENILSFLKDTYELESEQELFELEEAKHKEVIYDIYRTFTGCTPIKDNPGNIFFSMPLEENLKLRYSNFPDFKNNKDLFSHIRDMRGISKSSHQAVKETTTERIKEIKRAAEDLNQEREP